MSLDARELGMFAGEEGAEQSWFRWRAARRGLGQAEWAGILFILVNAMLFIRPAEIILELEKWPIYAVLMTAALLVSLPQVLSQLTLASLAERPISACVVGMLGAVVLSHLRSGDLWGARMGGLEFLKVLAYFLLMQATLTSVGRLRAFLYLLVGLGVVMTGLAVLQYHGMVHIEALRVLEFGMTDPATGEHVMGRRLIGAGFFHDPNDLCLLLVLTIVACIFGLSDSTQGPHRLVWIAPLTLFGYAFALTQSRGGFIGLAVTVVALVWLRLGWRRGLFAGTATVVGMFVLLAGRQTDLRLDEGTGQDRLQLWSAGLTLFRGAPIFGIGEGHFVQEVGHVAHNSFVHCFTELGLFGGSIFLGGFLAALVSVYQLRICGRGEANWEMRRLRDFVLAMTAGYSASLLTLSRAYVVPTYLVLGLAAALNEVAGTSGGKARMTIDQRLVVRLPGAAVLFLGVTYVFVRVFVRWG